MFPSFTLFGREIYIYVVLAIAGGLVAGWYACRAARRAGEDDNRMILFLLSAAGGALLGSHLLYALLELPRAAAVAEAASLREALRALAVWLGGGVFYGGLLGGAAGGVIYVRAAKRPMALYADIAACFVPLFHAFGRVGCFLGGCCFGVESRFGFVFTRSPLEIANGVRRFPVQLLESACCLLLFFLMDRLRRKGVLRGRLLGLYLALYALVRFADEFLRGDALRGFALGLSTSQWASLAAAAAGLAILLCGRRKARNRAVGKG